MIFHKTWEQVLDGSKTQTRRLVKDGDFLVFWPMPCVFRKMKGKTIGKSRLIWRTNNVYAVQPGRGKKGIGFIGTTNIRREQLHDMSCKDFIAEGLTTREIGSNAGIHLQDQFARLWDSLHPKGKRWEDNPEVWVLEFELVKSEA